MKNFTRSFFTIVLIMCGVTSVAQTSFFNDKPEKEFKKVQLKPIDKPSKFRTVFLDTIAFKQFLKNVPVEKNLINTATAPVIEIPMPRGGIAKFRIWETQTMAPELAAQFPDIRTYSGQGIDDGTATIKLDWTPLGFHAMILSSNTGSIFIDPYSNGNKTNYISYYKNDFKKKGALLELPQRRPIENIAKRPIAGENILTSVGTQLRTYDIAIACTHEYAIAVCDPLTPTVPLTLGAITTVVNRMNQIYERDLSIHFNLVANEASIIFVTAGSDPFTGNEDPEILIDESQTQIGTIIGSANYDIGHTFSTGAGGYASTGVVCSNNHKAEGVTGTPTPLGDPFIIDYVCHEIGHQFNAEHTFNSSLDLCGFPGQFSSVTNAEPGSGSTIMGYSASPELCDTDNLQNSSDAQFHALTFSEIIAFSVSGSGNGCATQTARVNAIPVVFAGSDYTIPKSTPFILTGTATDGDAADVLSYCWDQVDVGAPQSTWNAPSGTKAPLFRSFPPVNNGTRYFPKLSDVVNNTTTIGEILPAIARPVNFRLTVRDNKAGGGAVNSEDMLVTVNSNGPFTVTYPTASGITWTGNESRTVTWDVANSNLAPISTSNVSIQLSTDGGYTYPTTLLASTPNDGSEVITVPNIATTTARIRVIAVGNIFYDISNTNFSILFTTPVTWVDFSAQKTTNTSASLNWIVNESNTASYQIQRSSDGLNFKNIGSLAAVNLSGALQNYSFVDTKPLAGVNYYRVKQVDKNGQEFFSKIISVTFDITKVIWSIYPNPTNGMLFISNNSSTDKTQFQLYDQTGRLLISKTISKNDPEQLVQLNLRNFAKGVYTLKISNTTASKIEKVLLK